jgi:dephospho-CoA kinase
VGLTNAIQHSASSIQQLMQIIGLIGGVASGKSAVAAALARRGAITFDGDEFGHQVLDEPEVRDALVARWGTSVLGSDGRIARPAVANIVFGARPAAAQEREFLEQLVHPGIRRRIEAAIRRLPDDSVPAIVLDAALLIEAGWSGVCSLIAFVECPRAERLRRARARGWSEEDFSRREAAQLPIEEKRRHANHTIDNSGSLEELAGAVSRFWAEVVE